MEKRAAEIRIASSLKKVQDDLLGPTYDKNIDQYEQEKRKHMKAKLTPISPEL